MLQLGLFDVAYDEGNHLKITDYGKEVLYGRQSVEFNRYQRRDFNVKKQEAEPPLITAEPVTAKQMDKALFEKLRDVRKALATVNHVAPFMVFSDKSLQAMATEKPTTKAEFSFIHGVGEVKCQKYWRPFTTAIREYLDHN